MSLMAFLFDFMVCFLIAFVFVCFLGVEVVDGLTFMSIFFVFEIFLV